MTLYLAFTIEHYEACGGLKDCVYAGRSLESARAAVRQHLPVHYTPGEAAHRGPRGHSMSTSSDVGVGTVDVLDPYEIITHPARRAQFDVYGSGCVAHIEGDEVLVSYAEVMHLGHGEWSIGWSQWERFTVEAQT